MSASRLTVACCIRVSAAALPRSWLESRPQAHWTVPAPNTSPPLGPAVQGQVVLGRVRPEGRAVVDQHGGVGDRGRGEPERPAGARAVVGVGVPLVAERVGAERRRRARGLRGHVRVAPEAHLAVGGGHADRRRGPVVDHEELSGQRVLRAVAVGRRAEARVAPGAGPRARRVDLGVGVRLLVGDERPVPVLVARLPEHLVAAEEAEVHAGRARGLHVGPLVAGPVLVMADRQVASGARGSPRRAGRRRCPWCS